MIHKRSHRSPPRGLARLAVRLPIWLYRLQLGRLLGNRFLLLTHVGRTTGQRRQTVLEVVRHDRASDHYMIASGYGTQADWFRNLHQHPHVLVESGGRRWEAVAERLPLDVATMELIAYARRHPRAVRSLARLMIGESWTTDAAIMHRLAEQVPLLALRPLRQTR